MTKVIVRSPLEILLTCNQTATVNQNKLLVKAFVTPSTDNKPAKFLSRECPSLGGGKTV